MVIMVLTYLVSFTFLHYKLIFIRLFYIMSGFIFSNKLAPFVLKLARCGGHDLVDHEDIPKNKHN